MLELEAAFLSQAQAQAQAVRGGRGGIGGCGCQQRLPIRYPVPRLSVWEAKMVAADATARVGEMALCAVGKHVGEGAGAMELMQRYMARAK